MPYRRLEQIYVLAAALDLKFGYIGHIADVLQRANVRHGVTLRIARSALGLDVGLLCPTHATLLTSLADYELAVIGFGSLRAGLLSFWYAWREDVGKENNG